jgi:hypothetical protein
MSQPESGRWFRRGGILWLLLLMPAITADSLRASDGETVTTEAKTFAVPKVVPAVFQGDVRNLPQVAAENEQFNSWEPEEPLDLKPPVPERSSIVPNISSAAMPSPLQSFNGLSFNTSVTGGQVGAGWPPDVNGDVGPNHYIEAVNNAYAIYNKSGTLLAAFTENALWSGVSTTPCNGNSRGDPVVLHDGLADRWILTHFAFAFNSSGVPISPFYECIAVSQSSDPVGGGWWLYALRMDNGGAGQPPVGTLNDYPKFGLWTDCLYMSANGYSDPTHFVGTMFASLSRSDMYAGAALTWALGFISGTSDPFTMIPSNLLGTSAGSLPPTGRPNFFVSQSNLAFQFEVRKFTVPASCGGGGSLSAATNVSQVSYTPPGLTSIPQPGTSNKLASLRDRLMQRVQYRKIGNSESLWVVHSTQNGSAGAVQPQWAQLDVTGGSIATTPAQQQIYAPDTNLYRWMPGLAVDGQGNMALGYSRSNGTSPNFPSIAYSGRLINDPLNNLPQTETLLIVGSGSQNLNCGNPAGPCDRWGDYSAMSIDPADDCTFWYINEYYSSQSNGNSGNWQTRIGSFKFPSCGQTVTTPTVTTSAATGLGQTAATLNGTVNPHGSSTNAYFEWGTTTGYGTTTFTQNVGSGTTTVAYSVNLGSLACATTYHYRADATNSGGPGFGGDQSFTTSSCPVTAPTVTTSAATGVGQTVATLSGTVNPNGSSTTAYFEWGTTTGYGTTTFTQNVGSGTATVAYSVNLGSLACATTYHYRADATNSGGPGFGGDQSFTTSSCPVTAPTVTTSAATGVGQTGATLSGTVNAHGSSTTAYFEWGTTTSYGTTTFTQNVGSGTTAVPYSVSLGGLACATTYHYRADATNTGGPGFGGDQSFTTTSCPVTAPTVTTSAATGVGRTVATLSGTVNPNGSSTTAYFEWGTTTGYGTTTFTQNVGSGTTAVPYSVSLGSLACATTYHYRADATNGGGPGFGGDLSFSTSACSNAGFSTVTPCRLLDTRSGSPLIGGTTYEVGITGICGVPPTAKAISANITVVGATSGGSFSLWPAQTIFPGTTNINFGAGQIRANNTILVLAPGFFGSPGAVWVEPNLSTAGSVHLIIDISGYFE